MHTYVHLINFTTPPSHHYLHQRRLQISTHTLLALAYAHEEHITHPLPLFIIARNKDAATSILSKCREFCPRGELRVVQARDWSLLKNVNRICG